MSEIKKNSLRAGLVFAVVFGIVLFFFTPPLFALIIAPVCGAFFGIALYFFLSNKKIIQQTEFKNAYGETVLYSGLANHFMGWEAVGGKLYLLKDRLEFQSHSLNIQNHHMIIPLKGIQEIQVYHSLGIIPNGLSILTKEGKKEKFVLSNHKIWKEKIEQLLK
jgi:hypothetical protein